MDMSGINKWLEPEDTLDLNNCDREPLHIPGSIQPHGAFVAISGESVVMMSQNTKDVLGTNDPQQLYDLLRAHDLLEWSNKTTAERVIGEAPLHVITHRVDGLRVMEFEPAHEVETSVMFSALTSINQVLADTETTRESYTVVVDHVRALTGFDRVMAYVFDQDGHGSVVAEARTSHVDSFQDLRFPGTDIPKQARKLYTLELTRHIADVTYAPVALTPQQNPCTKQPVNMTFSKLRSVSPVHIQYLRNMGVGASFSVSVVVGGELIALIACHHDTPRHIDFRLRQTCELLGRALSGHLELRLEREQRRQRSRQLSAQVELLCDLGEQQDIMPQSNAWQKALAFVDAHTMLVVTPDSHHLLGAPHPQREHIVALIAQLCAQDNQTIHHSTQIAQQSAVLVEGGGLLVLPIGSKGALAWFRGPEDKLVKWAGKPSPKQGDTLSPRGSFKLWQEHIKGTSAPWSEADLDMAEVLRRGLSARFDDAEVGVDSFERAMQHMREYVLYLEESNLALHRVNDDLRQFAYAASHDMRAPLRTIRSFFPLVKRQMSKDASDSTSSWIGYVESAADTLHRLQEGLWAFSRVNRFTNVEDVDLNAVVKRVTQTLAAPLHDARVDVSDMPTIRGISTQIETVFFNLLDNASKYRSPQRPLHVLIDAYEERGAWILSITDNGIGFPPFEHQRIFDIFSRVHVDEAEGDGLGLALCRRIVHHHRGWIRASSRPGHGSTFEFSIKEPHIFA